MWFMQVLILTGLSTVYTLDNVEVTTPSGRLLGSTLTSRLGRTIYSFRGIRFAQPPVNDLRFKPPVPFGPWPGVYNATADGPSCPQPVIRPISEDCLFLNVYTTKLPKPGSNPKRPVVLFIHHGGFYIYTGRSNWVGPQYLLDQDVVLVTFNYRLETLGFLSVGKEAPGNNGMKDQVVAMRWVKKHIASFGGDPDNITLFGYSAGAWSVHLHMVSPMSRGLFHKAILGSGSALGTWPFPRNQLELAKKQARILKCPDDNIDTMMQCLKTKPAEDFGNSFFQFAEYGDSLSVEWSPVIEEDYGQERFLTEQPIKSFHEGRFQKVPVIAGRTIMEFAFGASIILNNDTLREQLSNNFERYAPVVFLYERNTPRSREISRALRKHYFGEGPLTNASLHALEQLYIDNPEFALTRGLELISENSPKPVYNYIFSYQGRYSHFYRPGTQTPYGVAHHDDLIYVFHIAALFPLFNETSPESKMVDTLTTMYANFVKTGNPNPVPGDKTHHTEWEQYTKECPNYLDIGEKLVLKKKDVRPLEIWRRLFPISSYL